MAKSLDDELEDQRPDKLDYKVGQDRIPGEPAPPAQPSKSRLNHSMPKDHPSRDSKEDSDEEYQEG